MCNRLYSKLTLAGLIVLVLSLPVFARGPGWSLSMPVFPDHGDQTIPFKITVGTTDPVQLFEPDVLKDRSVLILNPSPNYQLMIGTTSDFVDIDMYWIIHKGSGTETTSSHQTLWAMYPPGAASETVRGKVERQ